MSGAALFVAGLSLGVFLGVLVMAMMAVASWSDSDLPAADLAEQPEQPKPVLRVRAGGKK